MHCVCCDISDWNPTRKIIESLGAIDLLVNNAGVGSLKPVLGVTEEEYDK